MMAIEIATTGRNLLEGLLVASQLLTLPKKIFVTLILFPCPIRNKLLVTPGKANGIHPHHLPYKLWLLLMLTLLINN